MNITIETTRQVIETTARYSTTPLFDDTGIAITAVILFIFMALGLIGNGLTIMVIASYKALNKSSFINFILSLCVSDLISALISWLFLYRRTWGFRGWPPIPDIFCKFYWSADFMTSYVTGLHILSFAVLRLLAIQFPQTFKKITLLHARIWMMFIWIAGFACGFVPCWIMFGASVRDRFSPKTVAWRPACTLLIEYWDIYSVYNKIAFPIFLFIPILAVITISAVILVIVRSRSKLPINKGKRSTKKEKQAVLQLMLIVASFLIGYVPFTAYEFWTMQEFVNETKYHKFTYWFGMTEYIFLRFSETLNPLFYNLGSAKVRKFTRKFLNEKVLCCSNRLKITPSARDHSANISAISIT